MFCYTGYQQIKWVFGLMDSLIKPSVLLRKTQQVWIHNSLYSAAVEELCWI